MKLQRQAENRERDFVPYERTHVNRKILDRAIFFYVAVCKYKTFRNFVFLVFDDFVYCTMYVVILTAFDFYRKHMSFVFNNKVKLSYAVPGVEV